MGPLRPYSLSVVGPQEPCVHHISFSSPHWVGPEDLGVGLRDNQFIPLCSLAKICHPKPILSAQFFSEEQTGATHLGVLVHNYNPSIWEAETGIFQI
jgi:hypothetical protein